MKIVREYNHKGFLVLKRRFIKFTAIAMCQVRCGWAVSDWNLQYVCPDCGGRIDLTVSARIFSIHCKRKFFDPRTWLGHVRVIIYPKAS